MKVQKFPILAAAFLGVWWGVPSEGWARGGAVGRGGGVSVSRGSTFVAGRGGGFISSRPAAPVRFYPGQTFAGRTLPGGAFPTQVGQVVRFSPNQTGAIGRFNQPGAISRFDGYNRFHRFDRFNRFNRFNRDGWVNLNFAGVDYPYGYPPPWFYMPYGYPGAYGINASVPPVGEAPVAMLPPVAEGPSSCPVPVAGDLIGNVQRALRYQGLYRGPIDGLSGPALRASVRAYQARVGLPANGAIDARLLTSLGIM